MRNRLGATILFAALATGGCGDGGGATPVPSAPAAPATPRLSITPMEASGDYPYKTCPVSGEPLGAMGPPAAYRVGEVEVQLCCPPCLKKLEKDPAKYLAILKASK